MVACGLCYEALPLIQCAVERIPHIRFTPQQHENDQSIVINQITAIDGAIVQTITAIQKTLLVSTGARDLSETEAALLKELLKALLYCRATRESNEQAFLLDRGLDAIEELLKIPISLRTSTKSDLLPHEDPLPVKEIFTLNGFNLPRIFTGLWQLSSPAWGSASQYRIMEQFSRYAGNGLTAFDMADHYGDAELIFVGSFFLRFQMFRLIF